MPLGVAVGLAGCWVLFALIVREPALDSPGFATVWPAGGVAALWFLLRAARPLSIDTALLAAAAVGVNMVLGADPPLNGVFTVTNVAQTLFAAWLLRRWCPGLWGCGGDRPLDRPRMLPRFGTALAVASAAGALLGTAGAALVTGQPDVMAGVLFFGRNLVSALIVVTLGIVLGHWLSRPRPRPSLLHDATVVELVAATVFTGAMYGLAFAFDALPLVFPLLGATVWFGLRFSTVVGAAHSFAVGVATQTLTMTGVGPFAAVERSDVGSLLAEFYIATIVVTGLALSTGRDERQALAVELRRTQQEAVYQVSIREAVIGSMTEGLFVLDDTGELLVHNAAAAEIFGLPVAGLTWQELATRSGRWVDGVPMSEAERPSVRALTGEAVHDAELLVKRGDGTDGVVSVSAIPLPRDQLRGRSRALVLFRDISTEHARREELATFAGVVAHDLRNPLAAIDGWTEMLADELDAHTLTPDLTREFVSRVQSSSRRMHQLIRDLLAHATSGQRDLEVGQVDIAELVGEVAAARHAELQVSVEPVPPVLADPVLMRQVLDNLVGNALKYVAPGVEPQVTVRGCRSDTRMVTVNVADNGIGIPPGEQERIFEEFHRAHERDYEGSGLGLAIVRRIIARHDGTIVVRPNPTGQGSVFEFTLPAYD
ncbi:ATP-binding protein [Nocardioides sp. T2.26MG-1]|uniref:ATP-binding protein n=1 Tax=Nocardioides sp. T2.26MG-1 TaxID=3041166 RepID=UPI002541BE6F|nr:ATP-binding protein [Nocardioides sp. T2.26MG-1]